MKKIKNWLIHSVAHLQCTQANAAKAHIANELQAYAVPTAALLSTFCKTLTTKQTSTNYANHHPVYFIKKISTLAKTTYCNFKKWSLC
jgi:hypothetical protein